MIDQGFVYHILLHGQLQTFRVSIQSIDIQSQHPPLQTTQYHHHRQVGHFGSPPNGQFEHHFLARQSQPVHRMGAPVHNPVPNYMEDLESATASGGRRVLTLFPTGDD